MIAPQCELVWNDARLMGRFEPDEVIDEDLVAEFHRRGEDFRLDPSVGVPWQQIRE